MECSAHEHITSVGFPFAWEEKAPSPRPHTPCVGGISIPPSPQTFSEYFQDTLLATSLPQDPMMFQLATFSHLQTTEYVGSLPSDLLTTHQQLDLNTSFSKELAMSFHFRTGVSGCGNLLPTHSLASQSNAQSVALPLGLDQHQGISSVSEPAVDASQNPQQSKPLSKHQIYRRRVKGKSKFKDLSHQVLNEHIKMLNEDFVRITGELKAKDEQLSHLKSENHRLRNENKRLKLLP
ncbi:uncharacterized protein LOC111318549 [Durio zibethinus]|uniref:Uncharacterized protein LOC111318549 n=1 Tax=Durio zibethinus TaxID=66656 RepID=A0A6P6BJ57_DURZI|nr:uncharacterized protein LOC111318549 [Durio zibethinus]XP_022777145.1 uncharacterized protein LOC111318549 [Durio zibethinus]